MTALLVDVRERSEWDAGHAPKAKHHPLGGLRASMGDLPVERTLVVVCRSGNRSARATKLLSKAGYDAVNLSGGMMAWQAAGQPVVSARAGVRSARAAPSGPTGGRPFGFSPLILLAARGFSVPRTNFSGFWVVVCWLGCQHGTYVR
ncbi:MAG: rhodanese-like domain-containing protein [Acidimicrobiales bacterium]